MSEPKRLLKTLRSLDSATLLEAWGLLEFGLDAYHDASYTALIRLTIVLEMLRLAHIRPTVVPFLLAHKLQGVLLPPDDACQFLLRPFRDSMLVGNLLAQLGPWSLPKLWVVKSLVIMFEIERDIEEPMNQRSSGWLPARIRDLRDPSFEILR